MLPAARSSEVFAPNLLLGHVAVVTGGGTNLGRASAVELIACGAEVVIAGRRSDVLEQTGDELGPAALLGQRRHPQSPPTASGSSTSRSSVTGASTRCSTTPAASASRRPRRSPRRAGPP